MPLSLLRAATSSLGAAIVCCMRSLLTAVLASLLTLTASQEVHAEEPPGDEPTNQPDDQPGDTPPADSPIEVADDSSKAERSTPKAPSLADRFAGSSMLVEHSFSIGHGADLSPDYTRSISRTLVLSPSFDVSQRVSVAARLGVSQELTVTDTTYPYESMLDDLRLGVSGTLPGRSGDKGSIGASTGVDFLVPTSKASMAASLITAIEPWLRLALTAPLLDGLEFSYQITPSPRIHRYTTASLRQARPCSPAVGCSLGTTTDTGERNTALQLHHDIGLGLSALGDKLNVSGQLTLSYGLLYDKTPSERFEENTLSDPANAGGSPPRVSSAFIFDVSYQVHPGVGLSVGLWTPGGMRPDGGWYNPLGNRYSQVYLDVTLYPVALVQEGLRSLRNAKKAASKP